MKIKIYTCQRMTGRMKDEMVKEALMLKRVLENYGFECLNPVLAEKIEAVHEPLVGTSPETLEYYWRRDKEMIKEADIVLDFQTENQSDGVNKEIAYARWCLWKPVVRVWRGAGGRISRIEDDTVVETLVAALGIIKDRWGTYHRLREWREKMLKQSLHKWLDYQDSIDKRYGVRNALCDLGA